MNNILPSFSHLTIRTGKCLSHKRFAFNHNYTTIYIWAWPHAAFIFLLICFLLIITMDLSANVNRCSVCILTHLKYTQTIWMNPFASVRSLINFNVSRNSCVNHFGTKCTKYSSGRHSRKCFFAYHNHKVIIHSIQNQLKFNLKGSGIFVIATARNLAHSNFPLMRRIRFKRLRAYFSYVKNFIITFVT